MGLEAEPGFHERLYESLTKRGVEAFLTLGGHDIICRTPTFRNLEEFRRIVDGILFTKYGGNVIVANCTSYIILERHSKKTRSRPSAFCFIRSGRMSSRNHFDGMVGRVRDLPSVLAVSVVIGYFDLVCEVRTENIAQLKQAVDQILATPGVSSRAVMVCMTTTSK